MWVVDVKVDDVLGTLSLHTDGERVEGMEREGDESACVVRIRNILKTTVHAKLHCATLTTEKPEKKQEKPHKHPHSCYNSAWVF